MTDWRVERVVRTPVYRLYRDGHLICNQDGVPSDYDSEEEAQHVAANWELYRAPTFAELRGMTDDQLIQKHDVLSTLRGMFR